jgi:hypothetical protein
MDRWSKYGFRCPYVHAATIALKRPPRKKPTTASREGTCRVVGPVMAWPGGQPPA